MLNNLLKHSLRSFKRQRSYIIINILGLSIGITCSLLIALYVINEASYDKYNTKKDRIFRAILNGKIGGQEITYATSPSIMGPTLLKEFPEIEDYCRMTKKGPSVVEYKNQAFTDGHIIEADSSFFNIFSIPVLKGDQKNLLNAPHKVVLSESTAKRIFGNENPIDKPLKIGTDTVRYIVTGVMGDVPGNSHFEASMLTSFLTNPRANVQIWLNNSFSTYFLLKPNASYKTVDAKFPELLKKYVGPEVQRYMNIDMTEFSKQGNKYRFFLQNIQDAHLDPSIQQEFKAASDPKYLKIFGAIAILIVLIASINFMNLSTAQSSKRAKEVGIKKIGGSTRGMLVTQFLAESFILSFTSLILALIFIKITLPYFNNLLGATLVLNLLTNWYTIPVLILFSIFVGVLSGSYPAFFLSSFNPYEVLKAVIFSILAIFIAALGLFGLTSFTVEQRTKEIGVRKAMGSSVAGIYVEISKEIVILVSVSALIACPLIYYIADKWLQNFYYRITLGIFSFVAGLTIALGIALITISYRILKTATVNPAQSLKYE